MHAVFRSRRGRRLEGGAATAEDGVHDSVWNFHVWNEVRHTLPASW